MRATTSHLNLVIAALSLAGASLVAADLPKPIGAVNDFANVLTAAQEQTLTDLVQGVEDATTAEIAVATVTDAGRHDGGGIREPAVRRLGHRPTGSGQRRPDPRRTQ